MHDSSCNYAEKYEHMFQFKDADKTEVSANCYYSTLFRQFS